jgi:alkylation response protein AidB-like acyl-CoA dehydrogenase
MNFAFSDEQEMLRASARELVKDRYPPDRIAAIADSEEGFPQDEWRAVADLGWIGISVPEADGGAGLGFFEELILAEELGRGLYPGPFLSSVVVALPLVLASAVDRDLLTSILSGQRIPTVAWAGPDGSFDVDPAPKIEWEDERLTGTRLFVPDLQAADVLIVIGGVPGGVGVWAVERDDAGVAWRTVSTVDSTRRMGEVVFDHAPARQLGVVEPSVLAGVRGRTLAALAAEAVGVGHAALDLAVEHARTRVQFGKPIGAFQAVAHQLADAYLEIETARSLAYWAGWAVAQGEPEASAASAAAKARASEAAVAAAEAAIQVHGGLGFTWEHPLHRWYKRALGISALLGWPAEHRARVASAILD